MPPTNADDLNSCHDSCARITKVEICVASPLMFVGLHLLLVNMLVELSYVFMG
jgi:hypothetical protein